MLGYNSFRVHRGFIKLKTFVRNLHSNFQYCSGYEGDGKTTVTIINQSFDSGLLINSYSKVGFRLNNGMYVIGPMAIFPRTVLSWNISVPSEINEDSLSLFLHLEPKLDLLVLGFGDSSDLGISNKVVSFMTHFRINVEFLPTYQACSTFNFLNSEGRHVAAALIPPANITMVDDEVLISKIRKRNIYKMDD